MKEKKIRLGGRNFVELKFSDTPLYDNLGFDDNATFLLPDRLPDDRLEFPANTRLEDDYFYVGSGLAAHEVMRKKPGTVTDQTEKPGFVATDLVLFAELDWYGECASVLIAHDWYSYHTDVSEHIVSKVASICGEAEIRRAKKEYGEAWGFYILELAAVYLTKPLSRLWYAANMMSLFYVHYDDMRLGFLWAEYQIRMRHEVDSVRGKKSITGAQSGGEERARLFNPLRREIMQRMRTHIDKGKSVSSAALLTYKSGLGSSAEANRKLWMRHTKK